MKPKDDIIEVLPVSVCEPHVPAVLKTATGKEIKYLRKEEVHRMLGAVTGRNKLIIQMLWHTGVRVSELLSIKVSDIDFEQNTVTVRTLKKKKTLPRKAKLIKTEIKGLELALKETAQFKTLRKKLLEAKERLASYDKEPPKPRYRVIPISPSLVGTIASYVMNNGFNKADFLFSLSRMMVYRIIRSAGEKIGLEKERAHPHSFRHGFAVNATLSGVPPMVLRQWMGHASIESTLIYTEALAQDTKQYLRNMDF